MSKKTIIVACAFLIAVAVIYKVQPDRLTLERREELMQAQRRLDAAAEAAKEAMEDNAKEEDVAEKAEEPPAEEAVTADAEAIDVIDDENVFYVKFDCTPGSFIVEFHRDWAPLGAERVHELVESGFFEDVSFFRVISGFMAQFGIHGDPKVQRKWRDKPIGIDTVTQSNKRGYVTFAMAGSSPAPNKTNKTRTTQLFINYTDGQNNTRLDNMGFAPVGKVVLGMETVDKLYSGYGDVYPRGSGPKTDLIQEHGNEYLKSDFPKLDYIKSAKIIDAKELANSQNSDGKGPDTQEQGEQNLENTTEPKLEAHMKTTKGMIVLEMLPEQAPITVANFVNLAQRGYYDGIVFHRVLANFMIQGGDPTGTGRGGPGYSFEDEFDPTLRFDRAGLLAMANSGPRTNGSQFFITHGPTPHLNDKHTIFGRVIEGQDVVDAVAQGDKIEKLEIKGDHTGLLESQKDRIAEWNGILDK